MKSGMPLIGMLLIVLFVLASPWQGWVSIRKTKEKIARIRRCTAKAEAEIVSQSAEDGGDSGTWCTPTIRYAYHDDQLGSR